MNPKIIQELIYTVLWIRKDFFRIRVGQMVADLAPDPTPGSDPSWIFSNIFNINFTFASPSSKCVRLQITTRYKLLKESLFFKKGIFILKLIRLLRYCQILSVCLLVVVLFQFHFRSGAARVGKNPVFFKKTQPSGFFWVFWVFLGFFTQTRGFLGFFSVSRILLSATRL